MDIFDKNQLALLQMDPQEKNSSLESLLNNKNLSLRQLFSIKNIYPKIRSNLSIFIRHCQRNQEFCFNLIDAGVKYPVNDNINQTNKQICYIATDVLTCDQDIVADLLILPDKSKPRKTSSAGQSEDFQEIEQNIETEPQNPANAQETQLIDPSLSDSQKFQKKYKYLTRILNYITQNAPHQIDQNCINYIIKALNCLIRKRAEQFLQFLDKKPIYLNKLIELNNFSSINQFLIKIISDDDIHCDVEKKIKKVIIDGVVAKLKATVNQQSFNERLDFLDELFQTNKYASEDDRTELQKFSDIFSSKETITFFYEYLVKPNSTTQFYNSICYLSNIVKRMNIDEEVDPYSYSNEPKEQTMVFELDILFKQFPKILQNGYLNLVNLRFAQQYKQKMLQTRFYDFLVLLTKNSRFSNCQEDIKHPVSDILKGNNTIIDNQTVKIRIVKELIKQFFTQSKSGINRINIIALLQKIIGFQIYQKQNHEIKKPSDQETCKTQQQSSNKQIQKDQVPQQTILNNQDPKSEQINIQQNCNEEDDKKKKINKIKPKLKLNIKKFSLENIDSTEKLQQETKVSSKKIQEQVNVKKLQSSLKKSEILDLVYFVSDLLKGSTESSKINSKKKLKNNDTEISALVNKIIMLLCNSIFWSGTNQQELTKEKDEFINQVQTTLSFFNFQQICRNYSTTLATSKHPNATAKQKTNPQLNFIAEFVKNYSKRKEQPAADKSKQSSSKNLQLSDSDFKSDDDQQGVLAEKCSLEDFKKFTGFKFENEKFANKLQPIKTDRSSTEQKFQTVIESEKGKEKNVQLKVPEQKIEIVIQSPKEQQKQKLNPVKEEPKEKVLKEDKIQKIQEKITEKITEKETPTQIVQQKVAPKKQILTSKTPLQFYVRHRMIFA